MLYRSILYDFGKMLAVVQNSLQFSAFRHFKKNSSKEGLDPTSQELLFMSHTPFSQSLRKATGLFFSYLLRVALICRS
jgi:hypothetical protein